MGRRALAALWRYAWPAPWTALGLLCAAPMGLLGACMRWQGGVLEVSGGRLGAALARWPATSGWAAITLGHVVLGTEARVLNQLRSHEREHVRQYERWGALFVPAYLASGLWQMLRGRHPYRDNPFECQACAAAVRQPASPAGVGPFRP